MVKKQPKLPKQKEAPKNDKDKIMTLFEIDLAKVPKGLKTINQSNLLTALLYPMCKKTFFKDYYNKKAFVIRCKSGDPSVRIRDIK